MITIINIINIIVVLLLVTNRSISRYHSGFGIIKKSTVLWPKHMIYINWLFKLNWIIIKDNREQWTVLYQHSFIQCLSIQLAKKWNNQKKTRQTNGKHPHHRNQCQNLYWILPQMFGGILCGVSDPTERDTLACRADAD